MTISSVQEKAEIATQKDIFRLAAAIYSEITDAFDEAETQLEIIKCMLVSTGNSFMTCSEIAAKVLETYKYHISTDEVAGIIRKSHGIFQKVEIDDEYAYKLTESASNEFIEAQKNNIDNYIDEYILYAKITDKDKCRSAIHVYLYELTTTNINTYKVLLLGKDGNSVKDADVSIDLDTLDETDKTFVHDFLCWDNPEKNIALGNLVYCCLEYCLLINGDSPNKLIKNFIKRRTLYLDTNIIFRVLGINGQSRAAVVHAFLKKCRQANIKLIISKATKKEFFDAIDYYTSQIEKYHKGTIYPEAYEQITDYNIYAYYEQWRQDHNGLPLRYFVTYIRSLYNEIIKDYDIVDDEAIPPNIYNSEQFKAKRNDYSSKIKSTKQKYHDVYSIDDSYSLRDSHDATVIRYVELLRIENRDEKDIFFVSTDKILRLWDMKRTDCHFPIVVYPSQLFLILLKTCGRSQNDFDSFVSFINIRPTSKQITPEKAHIILSGISSITEDIETQKSLVSTIFDNEFQNIIKHSSSDDELYRRVQDKSQTILDEKLKENEKRIAELENTVSSQGETVTQLKAVINEKNVEITESQDVLSKNENELKKTRSQLVQFAERKTKPLLYIKCIIIPVLLGLLSVTAVCFILLQFFFGNEKWNFAVLFFKWVKTTPFGIDFGDYMYAIDAAILGALWFALNKWMRNPFNKRLIEEEKKKLIQKYLDSNKLS